MTTQNKNVPALRFPEFNGDWEEKKLIEVSKINPSNRILPDSFIYIDLDSVENGILRKENQIDLTDAPSRAQRLLEKNDILYQTVRPYQKNNLFFDREGTYVASTGYAQIRTENNPKYLFQYLHTDYFVDKVLLRCTGTSYPAINSTDLSTIKLNIPTLPEQQKIAAFLTAVDEKIQQLAKKKELLEQYKKGVMQKIFNQEIRFKDDNGNGFADWEDLKLGDVTKLFSSRNRKLTDAKVYSVTNSKGFVLQSEHFDREIAGSDLTNYKIIEKNDFAYNPARINVGSIAHFKDEIGIISSLYVCFRTTEKLDDTFLINFLDLDHTKYQISNLGEGGVRIYLWYDLFALIKIKLPSIPEQKKIAKFLSLIDDKINSANQQLEKTKEYKKGLLQQMFV